MCPLISGIRTKDAALSVELGMRALDLAVGGNALSDATIQSGGQSDAGGSGSGLDNCGVLKPGGHLVIKFLESEDVQGECCFCRTCIVLLLVSNFCAFLNMVVCSSEFSKICKPLFRKASLLRPKATRSSSREIYLICQSLCSG